MEARASTATTILLGLGTARIGNKERAVILDQCLLNVPLGGFLNILLVPGDQSLGNGLANGVDLGHITTTADADADIHALEPASAQQQNGLLDLEAQQLGLNEFEGLAVDADHTLAASAVGHRNGGLLLAKHLDRVLLLGGDSGGGSRHFFVWWWLWPYFGVGFHGRWGKMRTHNMEREIIAGFLNALHASNWNLAERLITENSALFRRFQDQRGWNLLHYSVWNNCPANVAKLLINMAGIGPNSMDSRGNTSMHDAAFMNVNLSLLNTLLELGGDVNQRNRQGETAVYEASHRGSSEMMHVLLARGGGNPNLATLQGVTPLIAAVRAKQDIKVIAELLRFYADTAVREPSFNRSALDWARQMNGNAECLLLRVQTMCILLSPYFIKRWKRQRRNKLPIELVHLVAAYL